MLLQKPDHLIWVSLAWLVPALGQDNAPQWYHILRLLASACTALSHLPPAPAAARALTRLRVFIAAFADAPSAITEQGLLQPLLVARVAEALAPMMPLASRPALVSAESLLWPAAPDAAAALYSALHLRNAGALRRLFSRWPAPAHRACAALGSSVEGDTAAGVYRSLFIFFFVTILRHNSPSQQSNAKVSR